MTVDHATTIQRAYDRINAGDLDGFGELVADDFVEHQAPEGATPGKEGVLEFFRSFRSAFPDLLMDIEDVIASGDKAVVRVRITGTHRGEFRGIPATGRSVGVQAIDIMRFDAAGLVCEHWGTSDTMTMMQQLGVLPDGPPD